MALGVVAGAHGVAAQLVFQNPGILPLEPLRSGVAYVWVALVAVQATDKEFSAVEVEAVGLKLGGTEAEGDLHRVQLLPILHEDSFAGVKIGVLRVPGKGIGDG